MCGIVAIWERQGRPVDPAALVSMRDALWHRGPDDAGLWIDGSVGLAHRRLSILDLSSAGHQPMSNEDGTVWITFNGEIYNYVELASRLRSRGHRFASSSDTEVLLRLYEEEGIRCLDSLVGMFAFAIWDSRKRTMFVARDRLGIKPLYYSDTPGRFALASEVKGLLAHPQATAAVDAEGLADYFFSGAPQGSKTMFAGIRQLPPAHYLLVTETGVRVERWWDVQYNYRLGRPTRQVVAELNDLIDDAVRIHCRSDADVGCHLSGGLDSSLVACVAAQHRGAMDVFSVRFAEAAYYDEVSYAASVAASIGARHHIVSPEASDLERLIGTLTYHQDFPIPDTAGFSYFAVSRLASQFVKVALTGHGGDEVFGGYPAQFALAFNSVSMFDLSARPVGRPRGTIERLSSLLRREGVGGITRRVRARLSKGSVDTDGAKWIRLHCGPTPADHPLLARSIRRQMGDYSPLIDYLRPFDEAPTTEVFDRALYHDLTAYLPTLLMKEDRASMAVSIESRVPLLDHRIIEYMATVPPGEKVPGLVPKALLREVASRHVPERVVKRDDKTPFPVPLREWVGKQLRPMARQLLGSERSLDRGVFSPRVLRDETLEAEALLAMLNVEMWYRVFIDRDAAWRPSGPGAGRTAFAGLGALRNP